MWLLYQIAVAVGMLLAGPFLLFGRGSHYVRSLPVRLGRFPRADSESPLWLHAVSVGEVGVAETLARSLPEDIRLLVSTVTPTGQELARKSFSGRGEVTYLPFDLGYAVDRFFTTFRPRALVLVEGDLWPLVLRRARRDGLPVAVVNGRVSDRSFRRMRRLRWLLGPILAPVDRFAVQTPADRDRLSALGVAEDRIVVTGNLKFDTSSPAANPDLERRLGELASGRPILIAGSTMAGEEEQVLDAFQAVGGGRALLLLAPRHPERWPEVRRLLQARGLDVALRSELPADGRPDVVLLDSLGELAALYRLAAAAFIGGTLVPTGGHNPLEPARFGVPIAVGPSMENFRAMAEEFDSAEAWRRVDGRAELGDTWKRWLEKPEEGARHGRAAAGIVTANRGALERTLEVLAPWLEAAGDAS